MSTAGLAAHAFELYGLDAPPRLDPLYALDPHAGCDLATFCRNPLHPGPCKGWKHTLKAVAPHIHDMLERDRLDKVEARRKARLDAGGKDVLPGKRKGIGKGRDGDGDGLKGEGGYQKKGRKKAGPAEPDPSDGHPVKLRKETRALVAAATKALPKDDAGWIAVVHDNRRRGLSPLAELVRTNQAQYSQALDDRDKSRDNWAKLNKVNNWEELLAKKPDMADEHQRYEGKMNDQRVEDAYNRYRLTRDAQVAGESSIKALGGLKPDGSLPDGFVPPPGLGFTAQDFVPGLDRVKKAYPVDKNGREVPPPELVKMHAAVQAAGQAIHADLAEALRTDPELVRLNKENEVQQKLANDYTLGRERMNARKDAQRLKREIKKREQALTVDALNQLRPIGGASHKNVTPITTRAELSMVPGQSNQVARSDWEAQLAASDKLFPTDWVKRSDQAGMELISTDRAFHRAPGDWRRGAPGDGSRITTLAMNTDAGASVAYDGGFDSYVHEVTFHELGHRMESQIPGLKALEFAYVRSRTTHGGVVEPTVKLKDIQGGGYRDDEVAYRDSFTDAYTGKTYEGRDNDPMNQSWEAFQVGLQDTFGRSGRKFGDESLQHFVLGAMATLGR